MKKCPFGGSVSGVTRRGRGEVWTAPGDTVQGVTPESNNFLWLNLERTLEKRHRKVGVVTRRQLKRSSLITLQRAMTIKKRSSVYSGKKVTLSVAARVTSTLVTPLGSV